MKIMILVMALWSALAFSQETLDTRFLITQRTLVSPFALPITINSAGEISPFEKQTDTSFLFQSNILLTYSKQTIQYTWPVYADQFNFYPTDKESDRIEVKSKRLEVGVGLSVLMDKSFSIGLFPYKGAIQTLVREKKIPDEKFSFKMPETLSDLSVWNTGDVGTFQTYGGISLHAGAAMGVNLATVSFGIQNQFIVEIVKNNESDVILKISEENLNSRQLNLGPFISSASFARFKGKRFTSEFKLNLENSEHQDLFKEALGGNIKLLQEKLPYNLQSFSWEGLDRQFYYGVPLVAGKLKTIGHYELGGDVQADLDVYGSRNRGLLTAHRNHQRYIYQTDEGMFLVWSSEMKKVNERAVEKYFLSKGRIIGASGFDRTMPDDTKFGSVISQIGIHISSANALAIKHADFEQITIYLRKKCEQENLSCRHERIIGKVMDELKELSKKSWEEMSAGLGLLLMKRPALIYAMAKSMKLKKQVYFKFLSENYQSLVGTAPIEI
jgi:hypothetical protein